MVEWGMRNAIDTKTLEHPKNLAELHPAVERVLTKVDGHENVYVQGLLITTVTNYFLRYLGYPSVIGKSFVCDDFSENSVEKEVEDVLLLWNI